jgi:hypothetical protein
MSGTVRFRISQRGQYVVIDVHTGRVLYVGSLDGARNAQVSLNRSGGSDRH